MKELITDVKKSKNVSLIVGAGISYDMGIALGYRIPILFGAEHPNLLKKYGIETAWQKANDATGDERWQNEEVYVKALVTAFKGSIELQQTFVDWLSESPNDNVRAMSGLPSDTHAAFAIAWLNRIFNHLVTTNWDFLLEYQIESIYEEAYFAPFEPANYAFSSGQITSIDSERLFFLNSLDEDDYFWHPRWDIVAQSSDLETLKRWTRPIWKIHGSPFFLACPKCGGFTRWKREEKLTVGDMCPEHPEEQLKPEITFWGEGINTTDKKVWRRLRGRLNRSDMLIASGFSGAGSDSYLRTVIEDHPNAWLVNPDKGYWDISKVNYVEGTASDFAQAIIGELLV